MNINGKEFNGTIGNTINTIKMGSTLVSTGRFPIESWKVWYDVDDAKAYVADTTASATAYPGMILAIVAKNSSYYSTGVEYEKNVAAQGVYLVTKVGYNAIQITDTLKDGAEENDSDSDNEYEASDYETEFVGWVKLGSEINSNIQSAIESLESSIGDVEDKVDTIDFSYDSENDTFTFTNGDGQEIDVDYPKVSISVQDNPAGAPNVSKRYTFTTVEEGEGKVTFIDIPKDSSLVSVKYIEEDSSESDSDDAHKGCLRFIYTLANGNTDTVYVDISETITNAELDAYIRNMLVNNATDMGNDLNANKIPTSGAVKSYVTSTVANIIGENGIAAETINMGDAANDNFVATTSVGFIDAGTTISYDKTVYEILKDILCKELIPATSDHTLPKITNPIVYQNGTAITGGSNNAVEIGTVFDTTSTTTANATYADGKLKTYGSGNYTMSEIPANCAASGQPYIDSISGAGVSGNKVREGAISFTVKQNYDASSASAQSSSGNTVTTNKISAGVASATASSRGAYMIWSGEVTNSTANNWLNNTNSNSFKQSLTQGWTNPAASGTALNGGTITHDNSHAFALVCPGTYRLYATQLNTLVEGTVNQSFYTHTLPDGTRVNYTLYVLWGQGVEYKDLSCRKI